MQPYVLTKLIGEQWGRLYSRLHGLRFVALRFFSVWGHGQRPDLALEAFTRRIAPTRGMSLPRTPPWPGPPRSLPKPPPKSPTGDLSPPLPQGSGGKRWQPSASNCRQCFYKYRQCFL